MPNGPRLSPWAPLLVTFLLTACGGPQPTSKKTDGGTGPAKEAAAEVSTGKTFNYVNVDHPKDFDPAYSKLVYDGIAGCLVFDGLVNFGSGPDVVPGLAEKWEVSDDSTSYTFHLRDAKFSDGRAATSADVKYSLSRLLFPEVNSDRKWVVERIKGAEAVRGGTTRELAGIDTPDSRTVVINLDRPYRPFLLKLAMPGGNIIPVGAADGATSASVNKDFTRKPIGTGPWKLINWRRDQRLEFVRNENYWGPKPKVDRFIYHRQDVDSVQRQMFAQGKLDLYAPVSFSVYSQWKNDPEKQKLMVPIPELNDFYVGFMNNKPQFQDKRVRKAISMAINRKAIFEKLQLGAGTLSHGPIPPSVDGYRKEIEPLPYDVEKAKALLKEAGAEKLKIKLWLRSEAQADEICASIAADLTAAGIDCELVKRDYAAINDAIFNGEPDMFYWSWWLDYPDAENALIPTFHSKNIPRSGNRSHYSNPALDKLLDQMEGEGDASKRLQLIHKIEDLIIEECPWVFLYHRQSYGAVRQGVKGYEPSLMYNANRYLNVDVP